MYPPRRRKKRHTPGLKTVELFRGKNGFGFTISGQQPCILSCIVNNSPADRAGLKTGDHLISVNGMNVSASGHDDVVKIIGSSSGILVLQIAENVPESDSSEDDAPSRPKTKYPNRRMKSSQSKERDVGHLGKDRTTHHGANRYAPTGYRRHTSQKMRALSPPGHEPHIRSRGVENINPLSAQVYPRRNRTQGTKHTIITKDSRIVKNHAHPDTFSAYAEFLKPPGGHTIAPQVAMSAQELSNVLYPSIQPHTSGTQAIEDYDSDGSSAPNLRVIVGYIGSIEMPRESHLAGWRLQSVRSAVRRLRVEQRIHTLVLMVIYAGGVRLTNTMGSTVAHYPTDKVAFSGGSADDKRFFGIVTVHGCGSEGSEYGSQDDYMYGSSCHVFMVDPELHPHNVHVSKARSFSVQCTRHPRTHSCLEFPTSAAPVLRNVAKLYRDRQGGQYEAELAQGNVNHVNNHIRSDSNTSTSDSGLGFAQGKEETKNDHVYVVEIAHREDVSGIWNANNSAFISPVSYRQDQEGLNQDSFAVTQDSFTVNQGSFLVDTLVEQTHYSQDSQPTASTTGLSEDSSRLLNSDPSSSQINTSHSSTDMTGATPVMQRLNIMENEREEDECNDTNSADNLRRSAVRLMQSRQKQQDSSDAESIRSSESSLSQGMATTFPAALPPRPPSSEIPHTPKRPVPALPNRQALTPTQSKPPIPDRKPIVPRHRTPSLPPRPERPKSTPPHTGYSPAPLATDEDFNSETESNPKLHYSFLDSWDGKIEDLDSEFVDSDKRKEEIFALFEKEQEKLGEPITRLHKSGGSLKQSRTKRRPTLSSSHESLVVNDVDFNKNGKLGGASSITSITDNGVKETQNGMGGGTLGRVASWALGFDKLLKDPAGVATFTEFLKKEFSEENIVFYLECENYKKITDPSERKKKAKEVFDKHLSTAASEPVNVDSQARQRTQDSLLDPKACCFEIAQTQIFRLMKTDSYPRFLKSDLYKESVLAEMENKPLPHPGVSEDNKSKEDNKKVNFMDPNNTTFDQCNHNNKGWMIQMLKKSKSVSSNDDGDREEKRRKSLLPWARSKAEKRLAKTQTEGDLQKLDRKSELIEHSNNKRLSKGALDLPDLNLISKEITNNNNNKEDNGSEDSGSRNGSGRQGDNKFCRVLLPDGSTTVIYAKPGQQIRTALQKLCDRRNMCMASMDVYDFHSDRPLDLTRDISTMGSKEMRLEQRVLLRIDLPNRKVIGLKAKPGRSVRDVLKPVLHKYGFKIDNMVVQNATNGNIVEQDSAVSTIDNQRILIQSNEDFAEWGGFGTHRGKPPLPGSKTLTSEEKVGSEAGGKEPVIHDLLESNQDLPQFDELGVLDPDRKTEERGKQTDEHRTSGIFSFIRRNSFGEKEARSKVKSRSALQTTPQLPTTDTSGQQQPPVRRKGKDPEQEKFFELLTKVQSHRLDDQRGLTAADLELPDFLKVGSNGRRSVSNQDSGIKRYRRHERRNSDSSLMDISPEASRLSRSFSQDKMEIDSRSVNSFESPPVGRIPYMDQSFTNEGVFPSHKEADNLFNDFNVSHTPNYNDSYLMEKSLRDIGLGDKNVIRGNTPLNKLPVRLSPHKANHNVNVPARMSRPQQNSTHGQEKSRHVLPSPGSRARSISVDRIMVQQRAQMVDQEMMSTSTTPSPTTHDLILNPDSSPDAQVMTNGHAQVQMPIPPARTPRRSPRQTAPPQTPPPPKPQVKKTLVFEEETPDVGVSQVSYV